MSFSVHALISAARYAKIRETKNLRQSKSYWLHLSHRQEFLLKMGGMAQAYLEHMFLQLLFLFFPQPIINSSSATSFHAVNNSYQGQKAAKTLFISKLHMKWSLFETTV